LAAALLCIFVWYGKLGLYYNLKEMPAQMKINFYSKYAREETSHLDKLIAFEDRARLRFGMEQISDDVRKAGVEEGRRGRFYHYIS